MGVSACSEAAGGSQSRVASREIAQIRSERFVIRLGRRGGRQELHSSQSQLPVYVSDRAVCARTEAGPGTGPS